MKSILCLVVLIATVSCWRGDAPIIVKATLRNQFQEPVVYVSSTLTSGVFITNPVGSIPVSGNTDVPLFVAASTNSNGVVGSVSYQGQSGSGQITLFFTHRSNNNDTFAAKVVPPPFIGGVYKAVYNGSGVAVPFWVHEMCNGKNC